MKSKLKQSISRWLPYWALCLVPLWTSCQTQHHLVLEPVGPPSPGASPSKLDLVGTGFLRVYSATETRHVGRQSKYYPHTDYIIYTDEGKFFKWVENATGPTDESPALVRLPAGRYRIRAQDDDYGRVIVPVVIAGGQTTNVHLEMRALPSSEPLEASSSVRLPDGRIVGWRAKELDQKTEK